MISTGPPRMTPFREQQLLEAHHEGDSEAMGELLEAYQHRIYAVCFRMLRDPDEATDLTQDALIRIIEGIGSYDGRAQLSTWIIRIAMNCCLSHLRKKRVRRQVSLDAVSISDRGSGRYGERQDTPRVETAGGELSGRDRVEQAEMRAVVHQAMLTLEPDARALLVLRDMQDLEYEQIAEVLDVPLGTVKSRLFRARAALRAAVEKIAPHLAGS